MLKKPQIKGCFIQGQFQHGQSENLLRVRHKHNGNLIAEMYKASAVQIESALESAEEGSIALSRLDQKVLEYGVFEFANQLAAHKNELIDIIVTETGKPEGYANVEVDRGVNVLTSLASSAIPSSGEGKTVLIISPFSLPLDQILDNICKELIQGHSVILKPSSKSPLTALFLASILVKTPLPAQGLQVISCDTEQAEMLAHNANVSSVMFTGRDKVASHLSLTLLDKDIYLQTSNGNTSIFNSSRNSALMQHDMCERNELNKIDKLLDDILDQDTAVFDDLSLEHLMFNELPLLTSKSQTLWV